MEVNFKKGISERQIDQLINYSLTDETVTRFTSDRERFKNREAFNEWMGKGREMFTMTSENDDLLGIIWLGQKDLPKRDYLETVDGEKYKNSFAIRIYGEARGKGLGLGFMKKYVTNRGVWLEVSDDNLAAKSLYSKFGFRQVAKPDENNKVIMIY